jgi:hypothetical protein
MIASTCGLSMAAATPWTRREATSVVGVAASPQAAEASVKSARPSENIRRRPNWSPSRPAVMSRVPNVRP